MKKKQESILREAERLINGPRRGDYGPAEESLKVFAAMFSLLLRSKLKAPITGREASLLMAGMKLCRETHRGKRDNRVDACGYLALADLLALAEEGTGKPSLRRKRRLPARG